MAAYATKDDIIAQHGERTLKVVADRDRDGVVDEDAIDLALESASAEVDSYLASQYDTLPLPFPNAMVKTVTVDIAVYRMASDGAAHTDEMRLRYTDAVAWLKAVARGDAIADIPQPPPSTNPDGSPVDPSTVPPAVTGGKRAGMFLVQNRQSYSKRQRRFLRTIP